jgi:dihydroceramidase
VLRRVVRLRVNDQAWVDRRTTWRAVALAVVGTAILGALLWWLLLAVEDWAEGARPATCLATRCFCEAVREGPVAQPANTVSSLAFVLVGLWAFAAVAGARRTNANADGALIPWLALVVALVGLSSAFYHATLTFLGQYLDVLSMYLLGALLLCGALVRRGALRAPAAVALFVAIAVSLGVAQYVYPESRRVLFALVLLPGIVLEVLPATSGLPWRDPRRVLLYTGIGLLVVAYGLWVLDDRGVLCWPNSLLQGHAAWHTLTAVSTLMLVLHYGATRPAVRGTVGG